MTEVFTLCPEPFSVPTYTPGTERKSALKSVIEISKSPLVSFRPFSTVDASDSSSAKYVARYAHFYLYTTRSGYEASIFYFFSFFFFFKFRSLCDSAAAARESWEAEKGATSAKPKQH